MQIEVPVGRVMDILAAKLAQSELQNARLAATNEVLTGRLQGYEERDLQQAASSVGIDDQSSAG